MTLGQEMTRNRLRGEHQRRNIRLARSIRTAADSDFQQLTDRLVYEHSPNLEGCIELPDSELQAREGRHVCLHLANMKEGLARHAKPTRPLNMLHGPTSEASAHPLCTVLGVNRRSAIGRRGVVIHG